MASRRDGFSQTSSAQPSPRLKAPTCMKENCSNPTWNLEPFEYCSKECRDSAGREALYLPADSGLPENVVSASPRLPESRNAVSASPSMSSTKPVAWGTAALEASPIDTGVKALDGRQTSGGSVEPRVSGSPGDRSVEPRDRSMELCNIKAALRNLKAELESGDSDNEVDHAERNHGDRAYDLQDAQEGIWEEPRATPETKETRPRPSSLSQRAARFSDTTDSGFTAPQEDDQVAGHFPSLTKDNSGGRDEFDLPPPAGEGEGGRRGWVPSPEERWRHLRSMRTTEMRALSEERPVQVQRTTMYPSARGRGGAESAGSCVSREASAPSRGGSSGVGTGRSTPVLSSRGPRRTREAPEQRPQTPRCNPPAQMGGIHGGPSLLHKKTWGAGATASTADTGSGRSAFGLPRADGVKKDVVAPWNDPRRRGTWEDDIQLEDRDCKVTCDAACAVM
mmetsp:Transcript_38683/g.114678  ORF Transcript_38683/g.114678 Transcript_38683/m.114678 type:complete len:451 (+) Transcript_38683:86-1438(+)